MRCDNFILNINFTYDSLFDERHFVIVILCSGHSEGILYSPYMNMITELSWIETENEKWEKYNIAPLFAVICG